MSKAIISRSVIAVLFTFLLILLIFNMYTIYETELTSNLCSMEKLVPEEKLIKTKTGETLESVIRIYNNGTLPLHRINGPSIIVFIGPENKSIQNFSASYVLPTIIEPHITEICYINISLNYTGPVSYYAEVYYYVGNWKPDPYLQDYYYVKYISEVEFSWEI